MKFLLSIAVTFFFIPKLAAQDEPYLPTAIEGANWIIKNSEVDPYPYLSYVHSIEGDTTVEGHTYKKVYPPGDRSYSRSTYRSALGKALSGFSRT